MRQHETLRDEAQIADDRLRRFADNLAREVARVEAFEPANPRIRREALIELPMADVDCDDRSCAPRDENVGEAAGRGPDVETDKARGIERKGVERRGELHAAA